MKKLFFASLLTFSTAPLLAVGSDNPSQYDLLKLQCAKGDIEACSTIIHRNSKLNEAAQKLEENNWLEHEKFGVNLLPLLQQCENGKKYKKFVKQVERLKLYKRLAELEEQLKQNNK